MTAEEDSAAAEAAQRQARTAEEANAVDVAVHNKDALSPDEIPIWRDAAKTLTPIKTLEKISEHNKFILSTVTTIGTVLTGFGAVTATVAVSRNTYTINGFPVVPAGALLTSALASLAVAVALFGRRLEFRKVNSNNLVAVKKFYTDQVNRSKGPIKWASKFFTAAAFAAAATAIVAGVLVVSHPSNPRSLASMSASVGADGAVSIKVSGTVDGLGNDYVVSVKVFVGDNAETEDDPPLIDLTISPDKDGVATISGETKAPAGSSEATAVIAVTDTADDTDDTFAPLNVTYPDVTTSATPTGSANQATLTLTTKERLTGPRAVGHLGGTVGKVSPTEAVRVTVVAVQDDKAESIVATATAFPNKDGVVILDANISPVPVGGALRATITVHKVDDAGAINTTAENTYVIEAPALR